MKVTAASHDIVERLLISSSPGVTEKSLSAAVDILECGMRDDSVVLYVLVKDKRTWKQGKRTFLIHPIGEELPLNHWKYYIYIGMSVKKGWAVFEII